MGKDVKDKITKARLKAAQRRIAEGQQYEHYVKKTYHTEKRGGIDVSFTEFEIGRREIVDPTKPKRPGKPRGRR